MSSTLDALAAASSVASTDLLYMETGGTRSLMAFDIDDNTNQNSKIALISFPGTLSQLVS